MILDLEDGQSCVKSHLEELMTCKNDLIADVEYLAQTVQNSTFQEYNCSRAQLFFENNLKVVWAEYRADLESSEVDKIKENFPFKAFVTYLKQEADTEHLVEIFKAGNETKEALISLVDAYWEEMSEIFD